MSGDPNIKPIEGGATPAELPQAHMVTPALEDEPGEQMEDAREGGTIFTKAYASDETRPQMMHGAVAYQEETATPGQKPRFVDYVDLTKARGDVRG